MSIAGASALAACAEEPAERSANGAANGNKIAAKATGGQGARAEAKKSPSISKSLRARP